MKYIIIIALFLASCSKNTCYSCKFVSSYNTTSIIPICEGDSRYNTIVEKTTNGITTYTATIGGKTSTCTIKD